MPELPEVEALAGFLRESAADLVVARVEPLAVNVLKTFDPPFSALLFDLTEAVTGVLRDAERAAHGLAAGELKAEKKLGLNVHGQAGLPCPRCGDTVREVSFADRSLQYCPTCQTDGRVLADRRMSRLLK